MENGTQSPAKAGGTTDDPSAFLAEIIGAPVTVKLNSGVVYRGLCFLLRFLACPVLCRTPSC